MVGEAPFVVDCRCIFFVCCADFNGLGSHEFLGVLGGFHLGDDFVAQVCDLVKSHSFGEGVEQGGYLGLFC